MTTKNFILSYPINTHATIAQYGRALPLQGKMPRFKSEWLHMGLDSFKKATSGSFKGNQHTDDKYTKKELIQLIEGLHENKEEVMSVREFCDCDNTPSRAIFHGERKYLSLVEESSVEFSESTNNQRQTVKPEIGYRSIDEAFDHDNTQLKGELSEMIVKTRIMACGVEAHSLDSDNCRYDLLTIANGCINRVQVKTGNYIKDHGVIECKLTSTQSSTTGHEVKPYKEDEIDLVCIYCNYTDCVYLIDFDHVSGQKTKRIRVEEPEVQRTNIDYAEQYKLDKRISLFG